MWKKVFYGSLVTVAISSGLHNTLEVSSLKMDREKVAFTSHVIEIFVSSLESNYLPTLSNNWWAHTLDFRIYQEFDSKEVIWFAPALMSNVSHHGLQTDELIC